MVISRLLFGTYHHLHKILWPSLASQNILTLKSVPQKELSLMELMHPAMPEAGATLSHRQVILPDSKTAPQGLV
jgi:hypothetical protein